MSETKGIHPATLRECWMDETKAPNYLTLDRRFFAESPVGKPAAMRRPGGVAINPDAGILNMPNSLVVVWPLSSAFVAYQIMRQRGGRLFYTRDTVSGSTYTDQTLQDGETAAYRVYGISAQGVGTLIFEGTGTQQPRPYQAPITVAQGQTVSGNFRSLSPSVPAITVPAGVTNYRITNFRVAHAGTGISVGANSDGVISNGIGLGLHPGVANSTHGAFVSASRPAGLTVESVDFDQALFGLYVNGQSTTTVKRLIFRKWRGTNMQSLKTASVGYQKARGYAGHVFQADHCFSIPVYDVEDGECVQEYLVGLDEDAINNYVSSGIASRRGNIRRLCLWGLWPIDGTTAPSTSTGYNYGCGIITDGIQPDADDSKHGQLHIYENLILGSGNAGIGLANGNDVECDHNKIVTSGFLPDGTVNRGTNVGLYLNAYSGGDVKRTNAHDNQSMCWDRPGSNNKPNPTDYPYNNAYDFSAVGKLGNVQSNNQTYGGYDPYAAVAQFAQEGREHAAWHSSRYQAGTVLGAVTGALGS
jgi:hypothetical protein